MIRKYIGKYYPIFLLPTLIAFTIAFIVPFVMGFALSFCDFTTVTNARFVGTENYVKIFTQNTDFLFLLINDLALSDFWR